MSTNITGSVNIRSPLSGNNLIDQFSQPNIVNGREVFYPIENFRLGADLFITTNNTSIESFISHNYNGVSGTLVTLSDGTTAFMRGISASSIENAAKASNFLSF